MVADAITGNISPEATTPTGNIFADATRGSSTLLLGMSYGLGLVMASSLFPSWSMPLPRQRHRIAPPPLQRLQRYYQWLLN